MKYIVASFVIVSGDETQKIIDRFLELQLVTEKMGIHPSKPLTLTVEVKCVTLAELSGLLAWLKGLPVQRVSLTGGIEPQTDQAARDEKPHVFDTKVADYELSIRASLSFNKEGLVYLGQVVQKTEAEMLRFKNFGRKSLNEVKDLLAHLTPPLNLGMDVGDWQPPKEK